MSSIFKLFSLKLYPFIVASGPVLPARIHAKHLQDELLRKDDEAVMGSYFFRVVI